MSEVAAAPEGATQVPIEALQELQRQLEAANAGKAEAEKKAADAEQAAKAHQDVAAAGEAQLAALKAVNAALEAKKQAAEERAEALSKDANVSRASSKERFRILIHEGREKSDAKEVPVGVNGRVYQIKRNVMVDVPREVVSVLTDAVIGRAEPIEDPRTGILAGVEFINAARFPFQIFGQSKDENGDLMPGFEPV